MKSDNTKHSFPCVKVDPEQQAEKDQILTTINGILTHDDQAARLSNTEA